MALGDHKHNERLCTRMADRILRLIEDANAVGLPVEGLRSAYKEARELARRNRALYMRYPKRKPEEPRT